MQHIYCKLLDTAVQTIFMIFLELRPEVKVTVTKKQYVTLSNPKMYPHGKFWMPTSNNIRDTLSSINAPCTIMMSLVMSCHRINAR